MPTITLPPQGAHPEHWTAVQQLIAAKVDVERVIRVHAAGDPLAERDVDGQLADTILYLAPGGAPCTAVLDGKGNAVCWAGWGEAAAA